jgi:Rrf2 family protein
MISQTAEYAFRAMACLAAKPEDSMTAGAIAGRTQVPADYLAKVLQQLGAAGLIKGRRGVGGGYALARRPAQIRLLDILNAVNPMERITTCPLGLSSHGRNLCPLHRTMDKAIGAVLDILDDKTLADLMNEPGANVPLCETKPVVRPTIGGARR